MNKFFKIDRLENTLLMILIAYMPLHYYISEIALSFTKIDNLFRDFIIIFLFFITVYKGIKMNINSILITFNLGILFCFAIYSLLYFNYTGTLNILRTYTVPMLMFFICSNIRMEKKDINRIHRLLVCELAIIGIYGFLQAFILGDDFLISIGYPNDNGMLSSYSYYIAGFYGYQRSVGTFISPNMCGLILSIALCVLYIDKDLEIKYKSVLYFCLVLGLLSTFSRSSIASFVITIFVFHLIWRGIGKIKLRNVIKIICIVTMMIVLIFALDYFILDRLFTSMLSFSIRSTFNGVDASALSHFYDLYRPIEGLMKNPFGYGFGNNGPMALENSVTANTIESSLYLMMYEVGIFFGILYFVPYLKTIVDSFFNKEYKYPISGMICLLILITYVFLPHVQSFEIGFYSFLFVGLYYNPSVKKIYEKASNK